MHARLLLVFFSLMVINPAWSSAQSDVTDELVSLITKGDSKTLATYFSSTLELNFLGEEEVYSKAQAELIIRDFFNKNKPGTARVQHKLNSNTAIQFLVISMPSGGKNFRISISLATSGQRYLIKEMRIELDRQ